MLRLEKLKLRAGKFGLKDVSLSIAAGQCVALMGKSGCGKSSVMEAICGLRPIEEGEIWIGDREVSQLAPAARMVGLVPQDNTLFPKMNVRQQIAYGPRMRKWKNAQVRDRVEEVAAQIGITHLLERSPGMLSGGEAKRVGLARAIASKPSLLCLDESFTGLDQETRSEVMEVVQCAISAHKIATLMITHRRSEAEQLADECFHLEHGVIRKA